MNKQIPTVLLSAIFVMGCSGNMPTLGIHNGKLMPCPKTPNCVSSQAVGEQYIKPISYAGTKQAARDRLLQIIESEKRTKILTAWDNYIRVEFTSAVFRFVDDVEFYFPAEPAVEKVIHVRSSSRIGHSDFGVNRKRIERVRSKFLSANK